MNNVVLCPLIHVLVAARSEGTASVGYCNYFNHMGRTAQDYKRSEEADVKRRRLLMVELQRQEVMAPLKYHTQRVHLK